MKKKAAVWKVSCVTAAVTILVWSCPAVAYSDEISYELDMVEDTELVAQSANQRSLSALVTWTLGSAVDGRVDVSDFGLGIDGFRAQYKKIIASDPGLFYALDTCTVWRQGEKAVSFEPSYAPMHYNGLPMSAADAGAMRERWNEGMAELMSWVPGDGTDIQKVKAVHDWLCFNVRYNYGAYNSGGYSWYDWGSYGALVEGTCVCSGYAATFSAAMALLGIPCEKVSTGNHAWNKVYVNGAWYHVDTAWDSCRSASRAAGVDAPCSIWFMKSDAGIRERDRLNSGYFRERGEITHEGYKTAEPDCADGRYDSYADGDWPVYSAPQPSNEAVAFLLSDVAVSLGTGQEQRLAIEAAAPSNANLAAAVWSSSDPSVVYVTADGRLEAGEPGRATVTCRMGRAARQCTVTVADSAQGRGRLSSADCVQMLRLYNPNSGEHFYTSDLVEASGLAAAGWRDEGVGWLAPRSSSAPVRRLYNPVAGEHHYTLDEAERDALVSAGWSDEGVGWHSDDAKGTPLYRDYNPNAYANNHNYTASPSEHGALSAAGWRDEGIAWYGL